MSRNYELYFNIKVYKEIEANKFEVVDKEEELIPIYNIYKEALLSSCDEEINPFRLFNDNTFSIDVSEHNYANFDEIEGISVDISINHHNLLIELEVLDEGNINNDSCIIYYYNGSKQLENVKKTYGEFDKNKLTQFSN